MNVNSFDLSSIFYKNPDNDTLTSIIKNKDKIKDIPIYLLNKQVLFENKKTLLKSLLDIFLENYFLINFFQLQTKYNEYCFIESLIELYIKEKEENKELLNLIILCNNYIPITKNMMEIIYNNLSKYFINESIHNLDEQYLIRHLKLLNLLMTKNKKEKIMDTIYFNGLNSKLNIKLNENDSNGFKIDYPFLKNGFFISFTIKINKKILDEYFKINKGIEINLINLIFDNNQNIKLSLKENYLLTFHIINIIKQDYILNEENFDFNKRNEIIIYLIPTSIFYLYINDKLIFKIAANYQSLQLNTINFFENYIGEVDSIFFSARYLKEELISFFIANKDKFISNTNLIKFFSKIFPDNYPKPFYLQNNDLKPMNELKKLLLKNKEEINFIKQNENINNYFMLFTPYLYNEKENIIDDICGNFIGILSQNDFVYYYINNMKLYNSIYNLLPILELMIYPFNASEKIKYDLIDKSIITENTFFEYFSLINVFVKNKFSLNLDFIESLSIFISKFPDEIFSERILKIIFEISYLILNNQQNIEIYPKKNDFLDLIILNLRIIIKFNDKVQIIWDKLYEYYMKNQEQLEFFPLNIICLILRYYDKNKYNQYCCEQHYSIFFSENTDKNIYKKMIMEPSFTIRFKNLFNILLLILEKYCYLDKYKNIRLEFVNIFKMLSLDISPCLQTLIIKLLKDYFSNFQNIEKKKKILEFFLSNQCIELILYVSSISLLNVQSEIIDLIQCWMVYYYDIINNYLNDKNLKTNLFLDFIIQNLLLKHLYVFIDENNNNFDKINEITNLSMDIPKINNKIKNKKMKEYKKVKITNFFNNTIFNIHKKEIFYKLINWMECKNKFSKNTLKINTYIIKYIAKFSIQCNEIYTLNFINSIENYLIDETCIKEMFLLRTFYKWLIQSIFIFNIEKKNYNKSELIIEKLFNIFSKLMGLSFENLNILFQSEEIFKIHFINTYILMLKKIYKNQETINEIRNIGRKLFNILLQNQKITLIYRIKATFEFMIIFNNSEEYENGNLDMSLYNDRIPNFIMKNLPINTNRNNNNEIYTKDIWLDYELFDKIIGSYEDEFTDFSDFTPKNFEIENKEYFKEFIKDIAFNPKKKNIIIYKFQNILFKDEKISEDNHYSAINILEIYIILICINLELTKSTDEISYWEHNLMKLIIFAILISINTSKKYEFNDFIQEKLYNILTFSIIYLKKRNQNYYLKITNNYIEPIFQFYIREKPSLFQKESQIEKSAILKIFKPIYTNLEELGIKNYNINNTELKSLNNDEINTDSSQQIKKPNDNGNNNNINIIIPESILKSKKEIKFTISIIFDEKNFYLNLFNFNAYIKIFKENYPKEFKENHILYYNDIENGDILDDSYLNEKDRIEKIIIKNIPFINNIYKSYFENYFILEKERRNNYKSIKKKLFSWRGFWSDKNLFFSHPENLKLKIKNHYTKEMAKMLLVPILDIDYYLPDFRKFNKKDLFLNEHKIYKIHLDIDEILQDIDYIEKKQILVKNDENNIDTNLSTEKNEELIYDFENINFIHNEHGFNYLENIYKNSYHNLWYNYLIIMINELENNFNKFNLKQYDLKNIFESNFKIVIIDSINKTFVNFYYCCLVKSTNHVKGIMRIDSKNLIFTKEYNEDLKNNLKDPNFDIDKGTCFGSFFISRKSNKDLIKFTIKLKNIKMILLKNYYYKNTAIEIFTKNRKSYFFQFKTKEDLNKAITDIKNNIELIKQIYDSEKKIIGYYIFNNKAKAHSINIKEYEEKWCNYQITSLEYLMRLNLIGNRSFIDLTQYPIFPWIITNYSNEQIDNLEKEIRKLNIPMGMIDINEESKERKEIYEEVYETTKTTFLETHPNIDYYKYLEEGNKYLEKYEKNNINNNEDNFGLEINPLEINQRPYFYGSHYSNPTYVCHYLMRIFPFSQILIEIQGDKFDNPDRLFCSLNQTFINATTQKVDIRELTPEFFYLPELYNNINQLNFIFGNEDEYKDFKFNVELPSWANDKNYKVTMIMRKLLENNKIKINKWIDLIFGINQKGKKSEDNKNIFQANTYINVVNIEKIDDIDSRNALLGMVEMGMTPLKLLNEEAKEKLSIFKYQLNNNLNLSKGLELTDGNEFICIELISKNYDNIVNIFKSDYKQKIFPKIEKIMFYDYKTLIIFTNTNYYYKMKINITESFIKGEDNNLIKIENNNLQNYVINYKMSNLKPTLIINNEIIIRGGYHNKILEIINYNIQNKNSKNESYYQINESQITYLAISQNNKILFCGEKNGTIEIYKKNKLNGKMIKKKIIIFHNDEITCISVNDKLDIFASVSYDSFLNIYTIKSLTLIRSIKLSNDKKIYGDYVFISYSPLPCIVVYILPLKIFKSFTINGSFINEINEEDKSNKIYSPIIFKNLNFEEFLIYGTDNGYIKIRKFPEMNLINKILVKENKIIRTIEISQDRKYCYAWYEGNKIILIKEKKVVGANVSDNFVTIGFHL